MRDNFDDNGKEIVGLQSNIDKLVCVISMEMCGLILVLCGGKLLCVISMYKCGLIICLCGGDIVRVIEKTQFDQIFCA